MREYLFIIGDPNIIRVVRTANMVMILLGFKSAVQRTSKELYNIIMILKINCERLLNYPTFATCFEEEFFASYSDSCRCEA